MSNALTPIITNQGRQALMSGFSTPNNYRFSHVALGDANGAGYIANSTEETLKNELQRVEIESIIVQDSNRLHITAVAGLPKNDESAEAYEVHEIGFFLEPINAEGKATDGPMLFAIYATKPGIDEKALLTKEPNTELLLAFDLLLPELGESDFDFNKDSYLHLTRASQNTLGIVQMATESEILAGEKDDLAISPLGLNTVLKKAVESSFADDEQTLAGESSLQAVTPAGLKHALTSQLATSDESVAGESEDKVITPSGLKTVLEEQTVSTPLMEAAILNNLATKDEAVAGVASDKAVTPVGLQAKFDEIEKKGSSEMEAALLKNLATTDEAVAGVASDKAVTPVGLQAKINEIEKKGSSDKVQDLTINGSTNFGSSVRQMLNLWKTNYGIGIQSYTQYYRTDKNFAWYKNGVHDNNELNPGKGGKVVMVLKDGKLGVGMDNPVVSLHVEAGKQYDGIQINHKGKKEYAAKMASDNGAGYMHMNNKAGKPRVTLKGETGLLQLFNSQGKTGIDLKSNENELFFADNGQIRSRDNNHRILFRRTENKLELREYGDIILSSGAKKGQATEKVIIQKTGVVEIKEHIKQEAWIAPKMSGTWKNYSKEYNPCGYYKDAQGIVHLRGLIKGGKQVGSVAIFVLNSGYRPQFRYLCTATTSDSGAINRTARLDICADGKVLLITKYYSWLSLDNISFRIAGV